MLDSEDGNKENGKDGNEGDGAQNRPKFVHQVELFQVLVMIARVVVINFKTYNEATGYRATRLAEICRKVEQETKVRIVAVPQVADLRNCVETGVECWVQHVDTVEQGKKTGWIAA